MDLTPLGQEVRRRRKGLGWTIRGLAERSGVSSRFLSDLERGCGNISIGRLAAVAGALQTSLTELVAPLDAALQGDSRAVVALVGLRGAGKSTIGEKVAAALGVEFVELDQKIEAQAGLPLSQIFEMHGEAYYRRLERDVLARQLQGGEMSVVAVGGGVVTDPDSWALLKRRATTIWLKAPPELHYRRVMEQGDLRPMRNRPAAMVELRALLTARARYYAESAVTIDTSQLSVEQTVQRVMSEAAA